MVYSLEFKGITSSGSLEGQLIHEPDASSQVGLSCNFMTQFHITIAQEFNCCHAELSKGMVGFLNYYRTYKFRYDEELGKGVMASCLPLSINYYCTQVSPPIFVQIYGIFSFGALVKMLRFPLSLPNQENIV